MNNKNQTICIWRPITITELKKSDFSLNRRKPFVTLPISGKFRFIKLLKTGPANFLDTPMPPSKLNH